MTESINVSLYLFSHVDHMLTIILSVVAALLVIAAIVLAVVCVVIR